MFIPDFSLMGQIEMFKPPQSLMEDEVIWSIHLNRRVSVMAVSQDCNQNNTVHMLYNDLQISSSSLHYVRIYPHAANWHSLLLGILYTRNQTDVQQKEKEEMTHNYRRKISRWLVKWVQEHVEEQLVQRLKKKTTSSTSNMNCGVFL